MIVDEEDLDLDEDLSLFQGHPFTGTVRAYHPNRVLRKESPFRNGFEEGLCKEWHSNGQLSHEWIAVRGVIDGKATKWHANGSIQSIGYYSRGIELSFDEWDVKGFLTTHREIDKQSELHKFYLLSIR